MSRGPGRRRLGGVPILADARVAMRGHLRRPAFALTVIVTLTMAIAATTAVFAAVDAMLVRGLPFDRPERLMWVASVRADNPLAPFTLPKYLDYRARTRSLSGLLRRFARLAVQGRSRDAMRSALAATKAAIEK